MPDPVNLGPIRSPRSIYKINLITVHLDDLPTAMDTAPENTVGGTKRAIFVKMKESIGDYFGLVPLPYDDPVFTGVFTGVGTNEGSTYRKNIGGFRDASYKLVAHSAFSIEERVRQPDGTRLKVGRNFRTMSIGFPRGHSVTEVIAWLKTFEKFRLIQSIITPAGHSVILGPFEAD